MRQRPRTRSGSHVVRFYERDDALRTQIAEFVKAGVSRRQRCIVMATAAHWAATRDMLEGIVDVKAATRAGYLVIVDAEDVVRRISIDGAVSVERFVSFINELIGTTRVPVRIFGEVVSLIAARGDLETAIAMEQLGHQLAESMRVDVLCAYDLKTLDDGRGDVQRVGACHHRSIAAPGGPSGGPVILLADDFEDGRELYSEFLEFQGYTVVTAVDGIDAVERARASQPALLLLDIQMPRMSGVEAVQILKRDPALANVPAIALTAHALEGDREAFLAQGFDEVVTKPCLPEDLVRIIEGVLATAAQQ